MRGSACRTSIMDRHQLEASMSDVKTPLLALLLFIPGLYLFCLAVYRLSLHPLAKFPGPRLAAVTRLWKAYWQCTSSFTHELIKLHEIYGKYLIL